MVSKAVLVFVFAGIAISVLERKYINNFRDLSEVATSLIQKIRYRVEAIRRGLFLNQLFELIESLLWRK